MWVEGFSSQILRRQRSGWGASSWDQLGTVPLAEGIPFLGHAWQYCAVVDPGFPRQADTNSSIWAENLLFDKIFAKNYMKMKVIGPRGEPLPSAPPPWIHQCSGWRVLLHWTTVDPSGSHVYLESRVKVNQPRNIQGMFHTIYLSLSLLRGEHGRHGLTPLTSFYLVYDLSSKKEAKNPILTFLVI